jgi:hypothetical protein
MERISDEPDYAVAISIGQAIDIVAAVIDRFRGVTSIPRSESRRSANGLIDSIGRQAGLPSYDAKATVRPREASSPAALQPAGAGAGDAHIKPRSVAGSHGRTRLSKGEGVEQSPRRSVMLTARRP